MLTLKRGSIKNRPVSVTSNANVTESQKVSTSNFFLIEILEQADQCGASRFVGQRNIYLPMSQKCLWHDGSRSEAEAGS